MSEPNPTAAAPEASSAAPAAPQARSTFLRDLLLTTLSGVLCFVAFPTELAPEYTFWPLIWISHVPVLWVLKDKTPRQAFRWGWYCGTVIMGGGYYWIALLIETFGGMPLWAGLLALFLHSVWLGFIWGLWAWAVRRISIGTRLGLEWSVPLVFVAAEFIVPRIFPAYMGNSQYLFPMVMQITDVLGITAVTFLVYRVNAVLFLWLARSELGHRTPIRSTVVTLLMLGGALLYGHQQIKHYDALAAEAPKLKVGLVEGDVGIFQTASKDDIRNHLLINQRLSAELEAQGAELIIWPESSYRYGHLNKDSTRLAPSNTPLVDDWRDDRSTSRRDRSAPIRGFSTPLLFGGNSVRPHDTPRWEGDGMFTPYNTAWLLDRDGTVAGSYDKIFLLVFGEYMPLAEQFPVLYKWIPAAGDLEPGEALEPIETDIFPQMNPMRIGVLICYEGILPGFVRPLVTEGKPHFLVNMTNDDWFGKTAERYLHFALTVPRAIEHRLAFARPTLTGVTAFVDPVGRIVSETTYDNEDTLLWDVPLLQTATIYQRIGDVFPWSCVGLVVLLLLFSGPRRRKPVESAQGEGAAEAEAAAQGEGAAEAEAAA